MAMTAEKVRKLEERTFQETVLYLAGLEKPGRLLVRSAFMRLPYIDKVKNVMALGQAHIRLTGGTGTGKTAMAQSFTTAINAKYSRIQGHPGLMPPDIVGDYILVENLKGERSIRLRPGKIYANVLFVDESNRIRPQTKAVILEPMEERSITPDSEHIDFGNDTSGRHSVLPLFPISGRIDDFDSPTFFMVLMTQNVYGDEEGTYPTPRAELDRTIISIPMRRPASAKEEAKISSKAFVGKQVQKVAELDEILEGSQFIYENIGFSKPAWDYKTLLIRNTDPETVEGEPDFVKYIKSHILHNDEDGGVGGASPRVQYQLEAASQMEAFFNGSNIVRPEHVKSIAPYVITHRLVLKPEKFKVRPYEVFQRVLNDTRVPGWITKKAS